jgi:DNA-binding transcriptional ArsR family regulator
VKHAEPSPTVYRALADPTRREILKLLRKGARNSGEIADRFDASWPTISRHLAVLHDAGLVRSVRRKQEIRYELNTSVLQDLAQHLIELVASGATTEARPQKTRRGRLPALAKAAGRRPQEV